MNRFFKVTAHLTLVAFTSTTLAPAGAWGARATERAGATLPSTQGADPAPSWKRSAAPELERAATPSAQASDPKREKAPIADREATTDASRGKPAATALAPAAPRTDDATEPTALEATVGSQGDFPVSSGASALPSGGGTLTGLGESFSAQLTTGTFTYALPLALPPARAGVHASLALSYSSGAGVGSAGVGWSLGAPAIARQTDRGTPSYRDPVDNHWYPGQDRFTLGGTELVPICTVSGTSCAGALGGEVMPSWAHGWQYFRAKVDTFQRYFWSPDHRTWRVQAKDGSSVEFGVPLDGSGNTGPLEFNPARPSEIYRWYLARAYDAHGDVNRVDPRPVNVVVYAYLRDGATNYLQHIYDTTPAQTPTTTALATFANHTELEYEPRPDSAVGYRAGFPQELRLRLKRVSMASKPFSGTTSSPRELVRRYHLSYEPGAHRSLLGAVSVEGRCTSAVLENSAQKLPETSCPRLPSTTFEYERVDAAPGSALSDEQGFEFEGLNTDVRVLGNGPPHSLGDPHTELMDVNSDGLPDVVVTAPGRFGGSHGVFLNGQTDDGTIATLGFSNARPMGVSGVANVDPAVLTFANPNVSPLDADGDGIVDLVHMPQTKVYSVFSPKQTPSGLVWSGRAISTIAAQSPKINFARDARRTGVMDVNADGLVDIVVATATGYQTYFALGRYPGGDGQFGVATPIGPDTASFSHDPVTTCTPYSAAPVLLGNPGVTTGDLNGDGLLDIVILRSGQIQYWPGRGNGFWGTGERDDCRAGSFAEDRHVTMRNAPRFGTTGAGPLSLGDVNGDGLPDLIEVRNDSVDVYLNDNGVAWTDRFTIEHTPVIASGSGNVRVTNIDGTGGTDLLWGQGHDYRYIDLAGGRQPLVLKRLHNGLGKTLELEFESAAQRRLAAEHAGNPWAVSMPLNPAVLRRTTVLDRLERAGRSAGRYVTEYDYRDPLYEGRDRDFRGFREAFTISPGATPADTTIGRSVFQLGECRADLVPGVADACSPSERWRDLGLDPLRGLPQIVEASTAAGVYLSTTHQGYELRRLYTGKDGRVVGTALPTRVHKLSYDTASSASFAVSSQISLADLSLDRGASYRPLAVARRADAGTMLTRSETDFDDFGNVVAHRDYGCVEGCPLGVDEVFTTSSAFGRPSGDASGWLWVATADESMGSQHLARVTRDRTEYNAAGDVLRSFSVLADTVPLSRRHETGAAVAPNPPAASAGVGTPIEIEVSRFGVDQFGTRTFARGPNGRCVEQVFDAAYALFPVENRIFAGAADGAGCGTRALTSTATFDRGTGALVTSTNAQGQPSRIDYDGFGRRIAVTGANPASPGQLAPLPNTIIDYFPTQDPELAPYSVIRTRVQDGASVADNQYHLSYDVVDGLGRLLVAVSEADTLAGDAGPWVAGGIASYDAKGHVIRTFDPKFVSLAPGDTGFNPTFTSPVASSRDVDGFGRTTTEYDRDGTILAHYRYHAGSVDVLDAADLAPGPRQDTYATSYLDGHGRNALEVVRTRTSGPTITEIRTRKAYLPTGEVTRITREADGAPSVTRWMRYDTFGRLVFNAEPNTSQDFNPSEAAPPSGMYAWTYAYNDSGDLVGTSDARGCGANYHHDAGGRVVAVDLSPCEAHQPAYTAPNLSNGTGTEAFFHYDTPDPDAASVTLPGGSAFAPPAQFLLGRLVSLADRAQKVLHRYDALGRSTAVAVRIAKPGPAASALASRYATRWYAKSVTYDGASRPLVSQTGNTLAALNGTGGTSQVSYQYSRRGGTRTINSSYGMLLASRVVAADGRPISETYGDGAATSRAFDYDARLRLSHQMTYRATAPLWSGPSGGYTPGGPSETTQLLLEDSDIEYDVVNDVTAIVDNRIPQEWPTGAKPVTRRFQTDDLFRVTRVTYEYPGTSDTWQSPFAAELANAARDPQPSPHVSFTSRVREQNYAYDQRGNITSSSDDANAFYDRSLGTQTHGTSNAGPDRLTGATNRATGSPRAGRLAAAYDAAGNLKGLFLERDGACLPASASCWQRFAYGWDELGRLASASRWDLAGTERIAYSDLSTAPPARSPDTTLEYSYASDGSRVLKRATRGSQDRFTAYVFSSLELRSTTWEAGANDYRLDASTTNLYVGGLGRLAYFQDNLAAISLGGPRLVLHLPDYLGSGSIAIDHQTGELLERVTYQGYGARENDYRPARWGEYRDPYGFTGKEDDVEVGLNYFGARYYSPHLGRWISPDAVTIHGLGSDMNPYAYVAGRVASAIDPDGNEPLTIIAIILVSAAIAATASAASQAHTANGWDFSRIEWGWHGGQGVLAAATVGAIGAGVAVAAAPLVPVLAPTLGSAAALAPGVLGGAAGGGAGAAFAGEGIGGIAAGAGMGAISGLAGGATGMGIDKLGGGQMLQALGGGLGGAGAGLGTAAATGQALTIEDVGFALGLGAAGAVGGHLATKAIQTQQAHTKAAQQSKQAGQAAGVAANSAAKGAGGIAPAVDKNHRGPQSPVEDQAVDGVKQIQQKSAPAPARVVQSEDIRSAAEFQKHYKLLDPATCGSSADCVERYNAEVRANRVTGPALKAMRDEFNRVKPKFWRHEAATNGENYSAENVARMRQGRPPIGSDGHAMELHHATPLAEGGKNTFDNLRVMTRTDHRLGDNYKKNHPNLP